jgi:hypothetical protein
MNVWAKSLTYSVYKLWLHLSRCEPT